MLTIIIPAGEYFNNKTNEFISVKEKTLVLEHSLVSISKWESKWHKPFLGREDKTAEEIRDYVRCMTLTQNVPEKDYLRLTSDSLNKIRDYIDDPMTATTFSEDKRPGQNSANLFKTKVTTSEEIYYWMIKANIPMECQKWHLNRLLTLIRICNIKDTPKKKMGKKDIFNRNRELNEARRKALHTTG